MLMNTELAHKKPSLDLTANGILQRLRGESPKSYATFFAYLELGVDSTLQEMGEKSGRTLPAVRLLSRRHHWMERAATRP
jgi:hypothetical protein